MGHVDASLIRQHVSLPHYASLRGRHIASFARAMGACSPYTCSERISTSRDLFILRPYDVVYIHAHVPRISQRACSSNRLLKGSPRLLFQLLEMIATVVIVVFPASPPPFPTTPVSPLLHDKNLERGNNLSTSLIE